MTNPSLISRTGPTQLKTLGRTQSSSTPLAVIRPPAVTARPLRRISRLVRLALTYALPLRPTPQLRRTRAYYRRDVVCMAPFRIAPTQDTHISTRSYPPGEAIQRLEPLGLSVLGVGVALDTPRRYATLRC